MKRLFLIFLLVLLPLQFTWAAAAAYCQHEEGKTTPHFGHHEHQHVSAGSDGNHHGKQWQADDDCGYCHLSCQLPVLIMPAPLSLTVPDGTAFAEFPPHFYHSHVPDGPKKPNWRLV